MTRDTSVNQNLRLALRRRGMRQKELAAACGLSYQNLHRAVSGRRPIYAYEVPALARALGERVEVLLGMEEPWEDGPWA